MAGYIIWITVRAFRPTYNIEQDGVGVNQTSNPGEFSFFLERMKISDLDNGRNTMESNTGSRDRIN